MCMETLVDKVYRACYKVVHAANKEAIKRVIDAYDGNLLEDIETAQDSFNAFDHDIVCTIIDARPLIRKHSRP